MSHSLVRRPESNANHTVDAARRKSTGAPMSSEVVIDPIGRGLHMTTTNIHSPAPTGMLDEQRDQISVIEAALNCKPVALTAVRNRQPGAYAHLYSGDIDYFARAKRPGGRAST